MHFSDFTVKHLIVFPLNIYVLSFNTLKLECIPDIHALIQLTALSPMLAKHVGCYIKELFTPNLLTLQIGVREYT